MATLYLYLISLIICILAARFYKEPLFVILGFIPIINTATAMIGVLYFIVDRTLTWVEK